MKTISAFLLCLLILGSSNLTFATEQKKLTRAQEKELEARSKKVCDGMMPLYGLALELYYKKKSDETVNSELLKKMANDEKNAVLYTKYLESKPLAKAVISVSKPHATMIMNKYPNDTDTYRKSIEVTKTVSLPPVCISDIKSILRDDF
jgi:hypothetical protein